VQLLPPAADGAHEVRGLEDAQVLRRRLPRHRDALAQLAERLPVVLAEPVEQLAPRRIRQGFEDRIHVRHYAGKYLHVNASC
jgi:hypothetical protein